MLKNLLTLLNPTSVLNTGKTGLSYDLLAGDFKIVKGVVHTSNLEMKGPEIMLTVEGEANLVQDTINAQVKAMPLQMLDKTIKAIPLLGQILAGGKKGGVIETYFKVHGKLSKPKFTLQPHKTLLEKPGSILKELFKLKERLITFTSTIYSHLWTRYIIHWLLPFQGMKANEEDITRVPEG